MDGFTFVVFNCNVQDIMSFWLTDDASSSSAVFPQSVSFPVPTTQSAFSHQHSSNQEANGKYSKLKSLNLLNDSETHVLKIVH